MSTHRRIFLLIFLGLFITVISCSGGDMTNSVIKVLPSKSQVKVGEQFDIAVQIIPGAGIAGGQLDFTFNPEAIVVNSVEQGIFLGSVDQTFFSKGVIDNVAGTVKPVYGASIVPGFEQLNTETFVTFKCTAKASGKVSNLDLSNVIIGSKEGLSLPFELQVNQVSFLSIYDLDGNGSVGLSDLVMVADNFGLTGIGDFDNDGKVTVLDMILTVRNFT
jgi:hypothetical protein